MKQFKAAIIIQSLKKASLDKNYAVNHLPVPN